MKEFLAGFKMILGGKELAGVCAGLKLFQHIQAQYRSFGDSLVVLSSTEFRNFITVTLYLAGEDLAEMKRANRRWSKKSKRKSKLFLLFVVCLLFGIMEQKFDSYFESGKAFGQWLAGLFRRVKIWKNIILLRLLLQGFGRILALFLEVLSFRYPEQ